MSESFKTVKSKTFVIYGYNQVLQLFFLFLHMKPTLHLYLLPVLYFFLLVTSISATAMSQSPEDEPISIEEARAGKYGKQYENRNPEEDAHAALAKGDIRLLGFATRVTSVPGVPTKDKKTAMDVCGVHLMEGFGEGNVILFNVLSGGVDRNSDVTLTLSFESDDVDLADPKTITITQSGEIK